MSNYVPLAWVTILKQKKNKFGVREGFICGPLIYYVTTTDLQKIENTTDFFTDLKVLISPKKYPPLGPCAFYLMIVTG